MAKPLYVPATRVLDDPEEFHKFAMFMSRFTKKVSVPISVSADYTVTAEVYWVRVDASGGARTISLPPVGEIGRPIGFIKTDSSTNAVTIDASGSETINGATTQTLPTQYSAILIIDNGTSWDILMTCSDSIAVGFQWTGYEVGIQTQVITTGTAKKTWRLPACTVQEVRASLTTASSSGVVTVDINEGGTTILSTKLTIDANEKTSETAATAAVISDATIADDAEMTIDIDGAGTGAVGLKVYMKVAWT